MAEKLSPTTIYLHPKVKKTMRLLALQRKCTDAEVYRKVINEGLKIVNGEPATSSTKGLLEVAKMAKKLKTKGPKDLSINHDKYLWDE